MKLSILKAAAIASVLVFNTAYADSIQVDLNDDQTLSDSMDRLGIFYNSHTTVDLGTGAVHTYAGNSLVGLDLLGLGIIHSSFSDMTNNGRANIFADTTDLYNLFDEGVSGNSYLSFGVDLIGTFNIATGITYSSGSLNLWQGFRDGSTADRMVMSSTFSSGGLSAGNQDVLSLSGQTDILVDDVMYFDQNGTPIGFEEYFLANPLAEIRLTIDQNVVNGAGSLGEAVLGDVSKGFIAKVGDLVYVSAEHNASLTFDVPEPTSLAILGLGLLGLAGTRRRKA